MPFVTIDLLEGRDVTKKKLLIEKVTDAVVEALGVEREAVSVYLRDIKRENFGRGGIMKFMPAEAEGEEKD